MSAEITVFHFMNIKALLWFLGAAVLLTLSCEWPLGARERSVFFPSSPAAWTRLYGRPVWSVRWRDTEGKEERLDGVTESIPLTIHVDFCSRILAYPYWPLAGIPPGLARPAGALMLWADRARGIELSWEGGVEAIFYDELRLAGGEAAAQCFNWPRFRASLASSEIEDELNGDPWTVDWRTVALKSVTSGFDLRRLRPRKTSPISCLIALEGPWAYDSPFKNAPIVLPGANIDLYASEAPATLFGPRAFLRYSSDTAIWFPTLPINVPP